jgi:transposase-like protein
MMATMLNEWKKDQSQLKRSGIIDELPRACSDELTAVEFFEQRLWKGEPHCFHCGSINVYKMLDAKTGLRNKRFRWRCHDCHEQFTIRQGTVFEESRIPLRHWAYAFWRAATSKKGVAALEIMRDCQITYKSALFMMHRIRFAMTSAPGSPKKLSGIVEADETYCGGKPRPGTGPHKRGRGTSKIPVLAVVQRNGDVRRQVVANVSAKNIAAHLALNVKRSAKLMTDEFNAYIPVGRKYAAHEVVNHNAKEYVRGDVHTNTAESSFAILKRGLIGIHHAVSPKHLHRYVSHYDFLWNARKMNDGERTALAIQSAEGKRLMYREPIAKAS